MTHFTAQEWTALLVAVITAAVSALASAVVSIIHALKSQANSDEIKERLGAVETAQLEHEKNAAARSRLPPAARLGPPPVQGGP